MKQLSPAKEESKAELEAYVAAGICMTCGAKVPAKMTGRERMFYEEFYGDCPACQRKYLSPVIERTIKHA